MEPSLLPWVVANGATTLINAAILGFLARREHNKVLGLWSLAWFFTTVSVVASSFVEPGLTNAWQLITIAISNSLAVVAFLQGAYRFAARPFPRPWWIAIVVVGVSGVLLGQFMGVTAAITPMGLFYCVGISSTGVVVWRATPHNYGARIVCVALILIGVHVLDYPLVVEFPYLAPWGYLLMVVLEAITALGMLMLHYEDARARWLQSERALNAVRRTEALGRVAGGVAHDFNNVLTVIQGHLDLLEPADPASVEASSRDIGSAVSQAARLTAQLLAFGRRTVMQPQAVDLREVVETTVALLGRLVPENIQLHFSADQPQYPASADRSLVEQIVLNLVSNARDAVTESGGRIEVIMADVEVPRAGVSLRVTDDGPGISDALLDQLFEPFFTTKPDGRGTGLGLASVEGAVVQLGGTIKVRSKLGEGSSFEVFLPQLPAPIAPAPAVRVSPEARGRILVVDDDSRVREVAERILKKHGHSVACAPDGVVALALCAERDFDVVLTDVIMPQMGGLALASELATLCPNTRVVFTSGYSADDADALTGAAFLPKPFTRAQLIYCVGVALSEQVEGAAFAQQSV